MSERNIIEEVQAIYNAWKGLFMNGDNAMYEIGRILNKQIASDVKIYGKDSKVIGKAKSIEFNVD